MASMVSATITAAFFWRPSAPWTAICSISRLLEAFWVIEAVISSRLEVVSSTEAACSLVPLETLLSRRRDLGRGRRQGRDRAGQGFAEGAGEADPPCAAWRAEQLADLVRSTRPRWWRSGRRPPAGRRGRRRCLKGLRQRAAEEAREHHQEGRELKRLMPITSLHGAALTQAATAAEGAAPYSSCRARWTPRAAFLDGDQAGRSSTSSAPARSRPASPDIMRELVSLARSIVGLELALQIVATSSRARVGLLLGRGKVGHERDHAALRWRVACPCPGRRRRSAGRAGSTPGSRSRSRLSSEAGK